LDSAALANFLASPEAEPDWDPTPIQSGRGRATGGDPEGALAGATDPSRSKSEAARNPLSHARCSLLNGAVSGTMFMREIGVAAQKFTCAWT